jgi:hypothetical protein
VSGIKGVYQHGNSAVMEPHYDGIYELISTAPRINGPWNLRLVFLINLICFPTVPCAAGNRKIAAR